MLHRHRLFSAGHSLIGNYFLPVLHILLHFILLYFVMLRFYIQLTDASAKIVATVLYFSLISYRLAYI